MEGWERVIQSHSESEFRGNNSQIQRGSPKKGISFESLNVQLYASYVF